MVMRITFKEIKKLSVETLSGVELGHVIDVVIDGDGQHIIQYEVKRTLKSTFLISRDQVARFEEEKMVVYDTAVPKEVKKKIKATPSLSDPAGVTLDGEPA